MRLRPILARLAPALLCATTACGCALARSFDREPPPPVVAPPPQSVDLEVQARARLRAGDAIGAVRALVERENHLHQPAELARNRDLIWSALQAAPLDLPTLERARVEDAVVRGWLELAWLDRSQADTGALDQWRDRYPEHPGAERLGLLAREAPAPGLSWTTRTGAGGIALLLPLSGPLAASAEAVRDGFIAAHFDGRSGDAVRVYDAGGTPDTALGAYQRALNDGASLVVGPLTRDGVAAIVALGQPPVPMVALNYLDEPRLAPFNFFQFGLAPEDEARAAADHAAAQGLRRAVALVPATDWGDRVLAAFDRRLRERGGLVVAQGRFAPGEVDVGKSIESLLGTGASEERHRALVATLGRKVAFEPRRRDDIDLVFFGARREEARLIWPQFRFHRASDIAAYTTAQVYDGGSEPELHGLRFCDMPWMLAGDGDAAQRRAQAAAFPSHKAYPRLFALGYDAWRLADQARQGTLRSDQTLAGDSGRLAIRGGAVMRGLDCAQMGPTGLRLLEAPLVAP